MPQQPLIILPDAGQSLLRQELAIAFGQLGFAVKRVHPTHLATPQHEHSFENLQASGPILLLCINMQGLGVIPQTIKILQQHNSKAAVWFVDNPWNVLSGTRHKEWRQLPLFVTDASFIPALMSNGAQKVHHLPLATCPASFTPHTARDAAFPPPPLAPFVFVGRSAFPQKDIFFANTPLDPILWQKATAMLTQGQRPTFAWWEAQTHISPAQLWPGKQSRIPALGAETASLLWRRQCLQMAASLGAELRPSAQQNTHATQPTGLDVFGDAGWQNILPPHAQLHNPIDYYAALPAIYNTARYSLNITSLQLPQGLTQRHFDTWMAQGLCITDANQGLELFPKELTNPISFSSPKELVQKILTLEKNTSLRTSLQTAWQELILANHTYTHRVQRLCEILNF